MAVLIPDEKCLILFEQKCFWIMKERSRLTSRTCNATWQWHSLIAAIAIWLKGLPLRALTSAFRIVDNLGILCPIPMTFLRLISSAGQNHVVIVASLTIFRISLIFMHVINLCIIVSILSSQLLHFESSISLNLFSLLFENMSPWASFSRIFLCLTQLILKC